MNKCILKGIGKCSNDIITISHSLHLCTNHCAIQDYMLNGLNEEYIEQETQQLNIEDYITTYGK